MDGEKDQGDHPGAAKREKNTQRPASDSGGRLERARGEFRKGGFPLEGRVPQETHKSKEGKEKNPTVEGKKKTWERKKLDHITDGKKGDGRRDHCKNISLGGVYSASESTGSKELLGENTSVRAGKRYPGLKALHSGRPKGKEKGKKLALRAMRDRAMGK